MRSGSNGADDARDRFGRDIQPQLDAAYNFARFLCGESDAAQTIVQEAFLRADRSCGGDRGDRAWLLTIVRHCYLDWLKAHRHVRPIEDRPATFATGKLPLGVRSAKAAPALKSESDTVRAVIEALPAPLREVLVLRELEGLSYCQIAEVAALPIGTVMARLSHARKEFAAHWRRPAAPQREAV
jgi:RNA polymerase sigma-70 factor, ECF subfamily